METWLYPGLAALLGLIFGSFATLAGYRLPLRQPVAMTRSRCPSCRTPLGIKDLFPLISWAMSKGRCRYCQTPVSWRYPMTEAITALLFVQIYLLYGFTPVSLPLAGMAVCLVILCITDFMYGIIPDRLQIVMAALGASFHAVSGSDPAMPLAGALAGGSIGLALRYGFLWLRNKDALGWGDIKFLAVAGLWIGASALLPFLLTAGLIGTLTGLFWRNAGRGAEFPFGPALAVSLWICLTLLPASEWIRWLERAISAHG